MVQMPQLKKKQTNSISTWNDHFYLQYVFNVEKRTEEHWGVEYVWVKMNLQFTFTYEFVWKRYYITKVYFARQLVFFIIGDKKNTQKRREKKRENDNRV